MGLRKVKRNAIAAQSYNNKHTTANFKELWTESQNNTYTTTPATDETPAVIKKPKDTNKKKQYHMDSKQQYFNLFQRMINMQMMQNAAKKAKDKIDQSEAAEKITNAEVIVES